MNESQVLYLGRWVSKEHFRTFVYSKDGKKLAKSYDEYCQLISSGIWNAEPFKMIEESSFTVNEIKESEELMKSSSLIEENIVEENVVEMKPKKGQACLNQKKV